MRGLEGKGENKQRKDEGFGGTGKEETEERPGDWRGKKRRD